jgi:HEAT repeat protein
MNDRALSPRKRDSGRLSDGGRRKLWKAIEKQLNPYGDKQPTAEEIARYVEQSPHRESGVSIDLIRDFINPTPTSDRDFKKAKILFACFGLEIDKATDWREKQSSSVQSGSIDWREICTRQLGLQKKLTFTGFLSNAGKAFRVDDVHVPLNLIERQKTPQIKRDLRPQGMERDEYTETQKFDHDEFLTRIMAPTDKEIAIIGEPGAGKTTLLTKIADRVLTTEGKSVAYPIWISLSVLKDLHLWDYLQQVWLKDALGKPTTPTDTEIQELSNLIDTGKVWLLLDGVDEMGENPLIALSQNLAASWLKKVRVVLTCRVNVWDGSGRNPVWDRCQIFKLKEFEYRDDLGIDRVAEFIGKWFKDTPAKGEKLRQSLDEPQRDRIKDVARNPLRLSMLCLTWELGDENLPDTKAELYRLFVDRFYEWKQDIFPTTSHQKWELDRALGKLARLSLDRAEYRFRLGKRAIASIWGKQTEDWLNLAKAIGWLDRIGLNGNEEVYAFYHPTFQEYFAACSIDDWDYFLPREHEDRPVEGKQYRIFEAQWREPILLWIGREDVKNQLKEEFIIRLGNFQEQDFCFYYYLAYFLAGLCVGEFRNSNNAGEIVEQVIRWSFGYSNMKEKIWTCFLDPIESTAREIVPLVHRQYAVNILTNLLDTVADSNCSDWRINEMAGTLMSIDSVNQKAIDCLVRLLHATNKEHLPHDILINLEKINLIEQHLLDSLERFMSVTTDKQERLRAAKTLLKLKPENQQAINCLTQLVSSPPDDYFADKYVKRQAAEILGTIDPGNRQAIDCLTRLLTSGSEWDNSGFQDDDEVVESLRKIDPENQKLIIFVNDRPTRPYIKIEDNFCKYYSVSGGMSGWRFEIDELGKINDYFSQRKVIEFNNQNEIDSLIDLLCSTTEFNLQRLLFEIIGDVNIESHKAIDYLTQLLFADNGDFGDEFVKVPAAKNLLKISPGNRLAIDYLTQLLTASDSYEWRTRQVAETLAQIDPDNRQAIDCLNQLLSSDDESTRIGVAETLAQIDPDNRQAIDCLNQLLSSDDESTRIGVAETLGIIDPGNRQAIDCLNQLLSTTDENRKSWYKHSLERILEAFTSNNRHEVDLLIELLSNATDEDVQETVANVLQKVLNPDNMPIAISGLSKYVTNDMYDSNFDKFNHCHSVIWKCAQSLSYPDFHNAWHVQLPAHPAITDITPINHIPTSQILDLQRLPILIAHLDCIPIDTTTLIHYTTIPDIAQELCNILIPTDTPTIITIPQLRRELQNRPELKRPWLFYGSEPTTAILTTLTPLNHPCAWMTETQLPQGWYNISPHVDVVAAIVTSGINWHSRQP